ncbi:MAG: methyltransferase [Proteobacteria bacterium]|nr:methyltransferase [Pseudomonadota bacterium]
MTNEMTSRERVYAALNHEETDRIPIDFGGHYNTSVNVIAYRKLKEHLGITSPTYARHVIAMLAAADLDDGLEILKMMGGDVLEFSSILSTAWKNGMPDGPMGETVEFPLKDGGKCFIPARFKPVPMENGDWQIKHMGAPTFRMPKGGHFFDRFHNPLAEIETVTQLEEVLSIMEQSGYYGPLKDDQLSRLALSARQAYEQTDFFILGDLANLSVWHASLEVFGYENYFILMASDPEFVHRWMDFSTTALEKKLGSFLKTVGPYLNGFIIGDDYGMQKAPQISPKMFRELVKPYLIRICDLIRRTCPHIKILQHSCGSVAPLIPDLIDAGVHALNPVQTTANNMDAATLKREFGHHLAFWGGGVSCQTTLFNGTAQDVHHEVEEKMRIFKPGGGYVFSADHDIQEHVPPEMILAVFQAAQKYGV